MDYVLKMFQTPVYTIGLFRNPMLSITIADSVQRQNLEQRF